MRRIIQASRQIGAIFGISGLAALAVACGSAAPATNATVAYVVANPTAGGSAMPAQAGPPRPAPASWAGTYAGDFDGGEGTVTIKASPGGQTYEAKAIVAGGGCSGEALGWGRLIGNRLTIEIPTGNEADGTSNQLCRIAMVRTGDRLTVSESGSCTELHGMSCGFSGTAVRRGGGLLTPRAAADIPPVNPLLGAWVMRGDYCASGSVYRFKADGSYGSADLDGTWRLRGSQLTLATQPRPMPDEPAASSGTRQRATVAFRQISQNEITIGTDRMRRCPAGGGREPWHPTARFTTR